MTTKKDVEGFSDQFAGKYSSYTDIDALSAEKVKVEQGAKKAASDPQRSISWGDYVMTNANKDAITFGRISTREDHVKAFVREENDLTEEKVIEYYRRGYRYGLWGFKFCAFLWPITKEAFEDAKKNGWETSDKHKAQINAEIREAMPDNPLVQKHAKAEENAESALLAAAWVVACHSVDEEEVNQDYFQGVVETSAMIARIDDEKMVEWAEAITAKAAEAISFIMEKRAASD